MEKVMFLHLDKIMDLPDLGTSVEDRIETCKKNTLKIEKVKEICKSKNLKIVVVSKRSIAPELMAFWNLSEYLFKRSNDLINYIPENYVFDLTSFKLADWRKENEVGTYITFPEY